MALGVAGKQAELAGQILDVMHDKGDTAVEFIKPPGLDQRLLAGVFRKVTGQLLANHAQQVEIFPVELARLQGPCQHHRAHQPFIMQQRHQRPCLRLIAQPIGNMEAPGGFPRLGAQFIKVNDEFAVFEKADSAFRIGLRGHLDGWPLPARRQRQVALFVGGQQQSRRAVGNIGQRLNGPLVERRRAFVLAANRAGKAQPFGAVIIAVLKQMLGQRHPQPAAQPL